MSKTLVDHIFVTNNCHCIAATDVIPGWSISNREGVFVCAPVKFVKLAKTWLKANKLSLNSQKMSLFSYYFFINFFLMISHKIPTTLQFLHYLQLQH